MEVKPGDRVTIHGLASKPELNGTSGTLVGAAANGRVTVRLDNGSEIALKMANLGVSAPAGPGRPGGGGAATGAGGFGGAARGFGGMPGGGMPGMPGGYGAVVAALAQRLKGLVEAQLASVGAALPPGVTANQLAAGVAAAALFCLWILSRSFPMPLLLGAGGLAFAGKGTSAGSKLLSSAAWRLSRLAGRPLDSTHLLIVLCILALLMGKAVYPSGSSPVNASVAPEHDYGLALREAYQQGYDDGVAGADPRPPRHIAMPETSARAASASGGAFGMGSMLRYGMVGSYLYKAGTVPGGGFSPQLLLMNLQANPMQAGMMLLMVSGMLF